MASSADPKRGLLELDDPAESGTVVPRYYAEDLDDPRAKQPTLTDEAKLEAARRRSMTSQVPVSAPVSVDVELEAREEDVEALSADEQVAILRDRLSPLDRVPMLARPLGDLGDMLEDANSAYVLGFVDSILPLETILDVAGLPELDTLRVFDGAVTLGVVTFRTPLRRR